VYLFTTCKIGKWEAKDESDSDLDKNGFNNPIGDDSGSEYKYSAEGDY
jgi:hypothetical protein